MQCKFLCPASWCFSRTPTWSRRHPLQVAGFVYRAKRLVPSLMEPVETDQKNLSSIRPLPSLAARNTCGSFKVFYSQPLPPPSYRLLLKAYRQKAPHQSPAATMQPPVTTLRMHACRFSKSTPPTLLAPLVSGRSWWTGPSALVGF